MFDLWMYLWAAKNENTCHLYILHQSFSTNYKHNLTTSLGCDKASTEQSVVNSHNILTISTSVSLCNGNPPVTGGFTLTSGFPRWSRPTKGQWCLPYLLYTRSGPDEIDTISQTKFSNAFSWKKTLNWFRLKFHWSLFPTKSINYIPSLVQIVALGWSDDKPLSGPMMAVFSDAYMRHSASIT